MVSRPLIYINEQDCVPAVCDDVDATGLLLERCADAHAVDFAGETPLMKFGGAARTRLLLEVAPDLVGMRGKESLMVLNSPSGNYLMYEYDGLEELLRSCEESVNGNMALQSAMIGCNIWTRKLLLDNKADAQRVGARGHDSAESCPL
jgi:hypothetical protein